MQEILGRKRKREGDPNPIGGIAATNNAHPTTAAEELTAAGTDREKQFANCDRCRGAKAKGEGKGASCASEKAADIWRRELLWFYPA